MASTNKTVNYELSQFEGTDKPSWEADYNADMLAIDTNMKAISDVADGASGSISTLADRVTTAEGNITTNANDIDALEARADALESGETVADGRLDALEAEQLIQNTAIEGNTQLGYNLARPYDSASTYAVGAYVLFQNTLYKCTTAVSTGEAFDPNKWLAIKATDEIAAGGYTLPTASASTLGGVKVGSGLAIDASGILSASGNVTITKIDNNNFTPDNLTIIAYDRNMTTGNTTQINLTDPTIEIAESDGSFIAAIGDLRIVRLYLKIKYNSTFRIDGSHSLKVNINGNFPSLIDAPNYKNISNESTYINTWLEGCQTIYQHSGSFTIAYSKIPFDSNNALVYNPNVSDIFMITMIYKV